MRLVCQSHLCACTVNSVLAIGGVGGLAVGLAGREILENLFTGLIILSSSPFEVGDEVLFTPPTGSVSACAKHDTLHGLHAICSAPSLCLSVLTAQYSCLASSVADMVWLCHVLAHQISCLVYHRQSYCYCSTANNPHHAGRQN